MLLYAIFWLIAAWAFLLYIGWQVVVHWRWRRQQRAEQTAAAFTYGQGIRVLDAPYDWARDPDALPSHTVGW